MWSWNEQLVAKDAGKTPIAQLHRKSLGIFGKARPASLEILPAGENTVETILITFVYIEKLRKDKERRSQHP
ncbi:hypothetical protein FPV67DRAFT_1422867 [Lyophyllum atratum]|nr:hypothetical protein FPV67DRAFT_1422867 [Lyophyllum atratum]